MANWLLPTVSSLYSAFVDEVSGRLNDSATLFVAAPSNQPVGSIRYFRSTNTFQEWDGVNWVDKVLSVAGGGTGANTVAGARTSLGLGTMSVQNANAVAITGGSVTGLVAFSASCDLAFGADNLHKIGSSANRPSTIYVRSGLVIPAGVDKYVTS